MFSASGLSDVARYRIKKVAKAYCGKWLDVHNVSAKIYKCSTGRESLRITYHHEEGSVREYLHFDEGECSPYTERWWLETFEEEPPTSAIEALACITSFGYVPVSRVIVDINSSGYIEIIDREICEVDDAPKVTSPKQNKRFLKGVVTGIPKIYDIIRAGAVLYSASYNGDFDAAMNNWISCIEAVGIDATDVETDLLVEQHEAENI